MSEQPRACRDDEFGAILSIINQAAQAYRGVIPADCWHEPYMSAAALRREIEAGVKVRVLESDGQRAGVMGTQAVRNVDLIRHAYVLPAFQGRGAGGALIGEIIAARTRPILVGAWAAAAWAIGFYRRHGFEQTSEASKTMLLETYWTISPRQIETSVVLAFPPLGDVQAGALTTKA